MDRDEPIQSVQVMGDFTQWQLTDLAKVEGTEFTFEVTLQLERGFKHRYQFLVNGNPTIDFAGKTSTNSVGNVTNFIMVPHIDFDKTSPKAKFTQPKKILNDPVLNSMPSYIPPKHPG